MLQSSLLSVDVSQSLCVSVCRSPLRDEDTEITTNTTDTTSTANTANTANTPAASTTLTTTTSPVAPSDDQTGTKLFPMGRKSFIVVSAQTDSVI